VLAFSLGNQFLCFYLVKHINTSLLQIY
jgi:hypothetical protein